MFLIPPTFNGTFRVINAETGSKVMGGLYYGDVQELMDRCPSATSGKYIVEVEAS